MRARMQAAVHVLQYTWFWASGLAVRKNGLAASTPDLPVSNGLEVREHADKTCILLNHSRGALCLVPCTGQQTRYGVSQACRQNAHPTQSTKGGYVSGGHRLVVPKQLVVWGELGPRTIQPNQFCYAVCVRVCVGACFCFPPLPMTGAPARNTCRR